MCNGIDMYQTWQAHRAISMVLGLQWTMASAIIYTWKKNLKHYFLGVTCLPKLLLKQLIQPQNTLPWLSQSSTIRKAGKEFHPWENSKSLNLPKTSIITTETSGKIFCGLMDQSWPIILSPVTFYYIWHKTITALQSLGKCWSSFNSKCLFWSQQPLELIVFKAHNRFLVKYN